MELLAAVGGGAFVVASFALGLRLMWLARRTRGFPEFVLGFALFLMGGLGYPLLGVAQQAEDLAPDVRIGMLLSQMLFTTIGMSGITVFTRRVFRPDESWAAWTTPVCLLAYAGCAMAQARGEGMPAALHGTGEWYVSTYVSIAVMVWAGAESLRYHVLLRRRLALGLADPAVVDRFRLWTVAMFTAASISIAGLILQEGFGIQTVGTTAGHLLVGPLGLVVAGALWLAFLPPPFYLRWLRRGAAPSFA